MTADRGPGAGVRTARAAPRCRRACGSAGGAAPGTLIRDQWECAPANVDLLAVHIFDVTEPHRGVVAPRSEVVGEDVEPDRRRHDTLITTSRHAPRPDRCGPRTDRRIPSA